MTCMYFPGVIAYSSHQGLTMLGVLVFMCYVLRTCLLLQINGPNVCVKKDTSSENRPVLTIECCPDFIEKNDTCHECPSGTFGKRCEEKCYSGRYGRRCQYECDCGLNQYCNSVDGCLCNPGFTGDDCSSECALGFYGDRCRQQCVCVNSAGCHALSGLCICLPGWEGVFCTEKCEAGTYGTNCSQTCFCTGSCDHVDGKCNDELIIEQRTDDAQDNKENEGSNWTAVSILLTVAGVVIAICIAVALSFVARRKLCKTTQQNYNNSHNSYDEINPYDEIADDQVAEEQVGSPSFPPRQENMIMASRCPHSGQRQELTGPHNTINNGARFTQSMEDNIGPLSNPENTVHSAQSTKDRTGALSDADNTTHPTQSRENNTEPLHIPESTTRSTDDYLQPYVSLNADRNDYLLPYSTIAKAIQCDGKSLEKCLEKTSDNCLDKTSDKCLDKPLDNCLDITSNNCLEKTSDNCLDKTSDNCLNKTDAKTVMTVDI